MHTSHPVVLFRAPSPNPFMAHLVCAIRWKLSDVKREIQLLEPLAHAESRAPYVLAKLRGRWAVPQECEMVLLQGYVLKLHSLGFGAVLHKASAAAIRATILNSAKSQYLHQLANAKKLGHKVVDLPFRPNGACTTRKHSTRHDIVQVIHTVIHFPDVSNLLSAYPDTDDEAGDRYIMGYTLVPPEIMADFAAFPPWDAFDCAHKRGLAQGILATRATLNANSRLQVISFHDLIGAESSLTCGAAFGAEKHCLVNSKSAVAGESP